MKRCAKGWPIEHGRHQLQRLGVRQAWKVISKPANVGLGIREFDALHEAVQQVFGAKSEVFLEFDA